MNPSLASPPHAPFTRRWLMLPVLLAGAFLGMFDRFVVIIAAPEIGRDLGAGRTAVELIVAGYGFTYASGLIAGGRLGDLFGFRRMFTLGMVAFTAASVWCGLAGSPAQLVVARLVQGLGAAVMVPQVLALMTATFPGPERSRAMSWYGVTIGVSSVAGQVLGGFLVHLDLFGWGWRTIFMINLPIGVAAAAIALWTLPAHHRRSTTGRLDPLGMFGITLTLALLILPLVLGPNRHWPLWSWCMLAAAAAAGAGVVSWTRRQQRSGREPAVRPDLFRNRTYRWGLAGNVAFMLFFGGLLLSISVVLQSGLRLSPLQTGFVFAPLGIALGLTSVLARRLTHRFGTVVITAGSTVTMLGLSGLFLAIALTPSGIPVGLFTVALAIIGIGQGLAYPSLIAVTLSTVSAERAGEAAGTLTTAQQYAGALGVAALEVLFVHHAGQSVAALQAALIPVLAFDVLLVAAVVLLSRRLTTR
jgi:MFS family permease